MAHKQLLLSFLVDILGEFVNGLTEDNLKVGVWGGKIKLQKLEVNKSGLDKLNLPLTVQEGYLDTLEVKIPWTNLDTQAVQITITGVHVLVTPVDLAMLSIDRAAARCREKRKEQLERAERVIEYSATNNIDSDPNGTEKLKNSSYKRRIMRKMAKNLEISFHNVHVRYEDSTTLSNESFNFGITMDSLVFKASDEALNEISTGRKVSDEVTSLSQMSYKLVEIRNVGVYWNVDSTKCPNRTSSSDSRGDCDSRTYDRDTWSYILHPTNTVQARIALNYSKKASSQTSVTIGDIGASLHLDKYQLHQAIVVQKLAMKASAKMFLVQHRPRQSPVEKPIYWWKYIIVLLTNNPSVFVKKIDVAMLCCKNRRRYISVIVKSKTYDVKTGKLCELTAQEATEAEIIEELLPIDALVIFRQIATKEALICNQQLQKTNKSVTRRSSKPFSLFKSFKKSSVSSSALLPSPSPPPVANNSSGNGDSIAQDISDEATSMRSAETITDIEQLEVDLKSLIMSSDTIDNSLFTLDLFIHTNLSLSLSSNGSSLAVIETTLDVDTRIRPTTASTSVSFSNVMVSDQCTSNPIYPNLLEFGDNNIISTLDAAATQQLGSEAAQELPIVFCYEKVDNASSVLSLTVQPMRIHFNILCMYALTDIFKINHLGLSWGGALEDFKRLLNVCDISNTDKTLEVNMSVRSLVVLIPANAACGGCLCVRMSDLAVTGRETSNNCVETIDDQAVGKISLKSISVEFFAPPARSEMGTMSGGKEECVIKPFDILFTFHTTEDCGDNYVLDVSVSPCIAAAFRISSIPHIMRIVDLLSYSEATIPGKTRRRAMSKVADMLTNVTESSSKAINEAITKIHSKIKTDPSSRFLECNAEISSLSLVVMYDEETQHSFILDIENVICSTGVRLFDFELSLDVDSLSLRDSFRMETQRYIIQNDTRANSLEVQGEKFMHITYSQYLDKKSPGYTECGARVEVTFGTVCLSIDASLFGRVGGLLDAFIERDDYERSVPLCDRDTQNEVTAARITTVISTASTVSPPTGVNLSFKLSEISILLNRDSACSVSNAPSSELEGTILLTTLDVASMVKIRSCDYIIANLNFGSVAISDKRDITRDFCYSNILYPFAASEHVGVSGSRSSCSNTEVSDRSITPEVTGAEGEIIEEACHLSIGYLQQNAHSCSVEFVARSFTVFLSFDIILEALAVITEHVESIKSLRKGPAEPLCQDGISSHCRTQNDLVFEDDSDDNDNSLVSDVESTASQVKSFYSVRLFVPNPQFIFLENPTEENSEAIVCRSRVDVHFRQDITDSKDPETLETIHISLSDMEFFALLDMKEWHPSQLLQPVTVEVHISTAVTRDVMTQAAASLHIGQVDAKFTLNDLILLQSIWMRRGLVSESAFVQKGSNINSNNSSDLNAASMEFSFIDKDGVSSPVVFYNICANVDTMSVEVVNDFNGSYLPLVRVTVDQTSCKMEGFYQDLHGAGSLVCNVSSYNASIREWEPILEAWQPEFTLTSTSQDTSLKLTSVNHVQFNITSDFLDMTLQTLSLLNTFKDGTERELPPAIKFKNVLGLPVTLLDGQTKKLLFRVNDGEVANIYIGQQSTGYFFMSNGKNLLNSVLQALPESVDLYFEEDSANNDCDAGDDIMKYDICPLIQLPVHVINHTNAYPFRSIQATSTVSTSSADSRSVVTEEIFEYQRYNPLLLSWVDPFLSSDPHRWSDASGIAQKIGKNSVTLPQERGWQWVEDWKIDVSAKLGVQIDVEGFHYGFEFYGICGQPSSLTLRTFRPLDCVRRRRWIRKRSLKQSQGQESSNIFWDVQLEKNGSKVVTIRSGLSILNSLPYDLSVHLDSGVMIGPIAENATVSVPLAEAKGVKSLALKPSFLPCSISSPVTCAERASDFLSIYNVRSVMHSDNKSYLSMNALVQQKDQSILVTAFPYASIFNALPCSVKFKFTNRQGNVVDHDFLKSAETRKLCFLSLKECNFVSLQLSSSEEWSPIRQLNKQRDSNLTIPLFYDGKLSLVIFMKVSYFNTNMSRIEIFTKCAFVDYTRLDIALSSVIDDAIWSEPTIRTTYASSVSNVGGSCKKEHQSTSSRSLDICSNATGSNGNVLIDHFFARSRRLYQIVPQISVGGLVHTDKELRFLFLPKAFQYQTYICTACEDRTILIDDNSTRSFINFSVDRRSMVFIMMDKRASVPLWMKRSSFVLVVEQVISKGTYNGYDQEIHYSLFGKLYEPGVIHLGSNFSKGAKDMYGIFIISAEVGVGNTHHRSLVDQITVSSVDMHETSSSNWSSGSQGMTLFSTTVDNKVLLGVRQEICTVDDTDSNQDIEQSTIFWSQTEVDMVKTMSDTKIPIEVFNESANMSYQLAYRIETLPGAFYHMKVLEVMPRYLVVNATNEPLYLRQDMDASGVTAKADDVFDIQSYCMKGWHKKCNNARAPTSLQVRFPSSDWCHGTFDINEVGSSEILLPRKSRGSNRNEDSPLVVNVEVKLADADDKCSVYVLFWKSTCSAKSPLSISNNCSFMVSVNQRSSRKKYSKDDDQYFEWCIPPQQSIPYGWADPSFYSLRIISISIGHSVCGEIGKTVQIDVLDQNKKTNLFLLQIDQEPVATVCIELQCTGRIIKIRDYYEDPDGDSTPAPHPNGSSRALSVSLAMQSIGLSVVAALPRKRELISFQIDDFVLTQAHLMSALTSELTIGNVQVDNYSETAVYPVLFRRHKGSSSASQSAGAASPFIQAAVLKELVNGTHKVTYFSLRVLKFVIEVDSGSIHLLLSDLFSGIDFASTDKLKAFADPVSWMSDFNSKLMSSGRYELTDMDKLLQNSRRSRTLFENIIIHPTQCFLTFVHTDRVAREGESYSSSYVDILASVGAVDLMSIRLNSFIVSHAIESLESLQARIWAKLKRDVKMQLAQIAGSLTILGSPVGLVRNVGTGVKSFFYEPAAGLVQSPLSFILGLHKGTSGLVSGVLSGTLNSTAALVGTASSGISFLSGDLEYMQNRSLKMKKQQAARGGALSGIVDGSVAAVTGIASGVSGVVMRPVEGAMKEGTLGFVKGVGKGVAGVAVKPVLGVTDGLTSIVQGISNEVGQSYGYDHIRPPRALSRLVTNSDARLLCCFNMNDAHAQACVVAHSRAVGMDDEFISQITMENGFQVIFSEKCVWWIGNNQKQLFFLWDDISYVLCKTGQLEINLSVGSSVPVYIDVSAPFVKQVYTLFLSFSDKMTNPSVMRNALHREASQQQSRLRSLSLSHSRHLSPASFRYVFGRHNNDYYEMKRMKEGDIIVQARAKLLVAPALNLGEDSANFDCKRGAGEESRQERKDQLFEYIDQAASWLIRQWDMNHSSQEGEERSPSHCSATLIINDSQSPVEVFSADIISGRAMWCLGSEGSYCAFGCSSSDSGGGGKGTEKVIPAGGYVLIVVCGNTPSFFHSGNIEVMMHMTACDVLVTNNEEKTAVVVVKSPFRAYFVEKTNTDSWSKHVLYITED